MTERVKFTPDRVAKWPLPAAGEITVRDSESRLELRVRASGSKVWTVRYRLGGRGTPQRYTIAAVDEIGLAEARGIADKHHQTARAGQDPAEARRTAAEGPSVEKVVDHYVQWLKSQQVVEWHRVESLLRRELVAQLGPKLAKNVKGATFMARVLAVRESGRLEVAKKLEQRLREMMALAVRDELLARDPMPPKIRAKHTKARVQAEAPRGRHLDTKELPALWRAAEEAQGAFGAYVKLLLLTGCRRTELAVASLDWISSAEGVSWLTIPPAVTKNGLQHRVPLPPLALQIIREVARKPAERRLFPPLRGAVIGWSQGWRSFTKAAEAKGLRGRLIIHDLRRTARSHWARLGVPEAVSELMLNHQQRSSLAGIYNREPFWPQRVEAAAMWADEITRLVHAAPAAGLASLAEAREAAA